MVLLTALRRWLRRWRHGGSSEEEASALAEMEKEVGQQTLQDATLQRCSPVTESKQEPDSVLRLLHEVAEDQPAGSRILHDVEPPPARELVVEASQVACTLRALRSGR